jgi:rhodanese-related sulfurtransferase
MKTTNPGITSAELETLLERGCCLVDVREPVEYAEEHIGHARLIPLGELERRAGEIPAEQPVVLMCRSGKRGAQAAARLESLGFSDVRNLEGGILSWKAAGKPTERDGRRVLPLLQQVQIVIGLCVLTGAILAWTVDPAWVFLCAFFGAGLVFAGATGFCGLAILISKLPWNRIRGAAGTAGSSAR